MTGKIERISLPAWVVEDADDIMRLMDGGDAIDCGDPLDAALDLLRFIATHAQGGINEPEVACRVCGEACDFDDGHCGEAYYDDLGPCCGHGSCPTNPDAEVDA